MTVSPEEIRERTRLVLQLPVEKRQEAYKLSTPALRAIVAKVEQKPRPKSVATSTTPAAPKRPSAEELRVKRALGVSADTNARSCREIGGQFFLDVPADFVPNRGAE